jgi:hypothetical protein
VLLNSATAYPYSKIPSLINEGRNYTEWEYRDAIAKLLVGQTRGVRINFGDADRLTLMTHMATNLMIMNKDVLINRADKWLGEGCDHLKNWKLRILLAKVLAAASEKDLLFPSVTEAERLCKLIPRCSKLIVKNCDHLITKDHFEMLTALDSVY